MCYYLKDKISNLKDENESNPGSWKSREEFRRFREAIHGTDTQPAMPECGVEKGGKEFFETMPECFFKHFLIPYKKHIETCWRGSVMLFPYLLAADPRIARLAARYLYLAKEGEVFDEDETPFIDSLVESCIELKGHVPQQDIKIDAISCMVYLTSQYNEVSCKVERLDTQKLLENPLVVKHWKDIENMAQAEALVDIYDKSTWGDGDYTELLNTVVSQILPHMVNNQRMERSVQAFNIVSKNNKGEARISAECMLFNMIKYPFNEHCLATLKAKQDTEEDKAKLSRARGVHRVSQMCPFIIYGIFAQLDIALTRIPLEEQKRIILEMGSTDSKASQEELEKQMAEYTAAIAGERKNKAGENKPLDMHVPAAMGGAVLVSKIQRGKGHDRHVQAEFNERGLVLAKPVTDMNWDDVKKILKKDEYDKMENRPQQIKQEEDIKEIVPRSDLMKELLFSD